MSQDKLQTFLENMRAEFLAGRLEELTARLALPFVTYSVAGVHVHRTREEMLVQTAQYRSILVGMSVVSSIIKIVSRDPPMNNRMRATVRITDFDADGVVVTGSLVRYFLILKDESYEMEMIEYVEAPFSTEVVEQLVH